MILNHAVSRAELQNLKETNIKTFSKYEIGKCIQQSLTQTTNPFS